MGYLGRRDSGYRSRRLLIASLDRYGQIAELHRQSPVDAANHETLDLLDRCEFSGRVDRISSLRRIQFSARKNNISSLKELFQLMSSNFEPGPVGAVYLYVNSLRLVTPEFNSGDTVDQFDLLLYPFRQFIQFPRRVLVVTSPG